MRPESGRIEPECQLQNQALAGAGHAEHGLRLAARQVERNSTQHFVIRERHCHVFEHNDRGGIILRGHGSGIERQGRGRHGISDKKA